MSLRFALRRGFCANTLRNLKPRAFSAAASASGVSSVFSSSSVVSSVRSFSSLPASTTTALMHRQAKLPAAGHPASRLTPPQALVMAALTRSFAGGGHDGPAAGPDKVRLPTSSPRFKEWTGKDGYFENSLHPAAATGTHDNRKVVYFMIGAARLVYATAVRLAILRIVHYFAASADKIALGSTVVKLEQIPLGYTITVMWRGKPVFIRHRPQEEIDSVRATPLAELKDPQEDTARVKRPDFLVVLGICTHLGCVPLHNQGDYKGYFCPCHGSHYDASGRIRKGPAPLNLEVPPYSFDGDKLVIGE